MQISFLDETGLSPLPPGVAIAFYPLGESLVASDLADSQATGVAGLVTTSLTNGQTYVAIFAGFYAPSTTQIFTTTQDGSPFSVVVANFRSPNFSPTGFQAAQESVWPRNWIGSQLPSNPVGDALAYGLGSMFARLDTQAQIIRAGERLDSCSGELIDRWVMDYVGRALPRYTDETDAHYVARVISIIASEGNTIAAIQAVANAWLVSSADIPKSLHGIASDVAGAADVDGGSDIKTFVGNAPAAGVSVGVGDISGGADIGGGSDLPVSALSAPYMYVFDWRTDPTNAAIINLQPGYFGVALLYHGTSNPMTVTSSFSPDLDYLFSFVRSSAYQPIYATNNPQGS